MDFLLNLHTYETQFRQKHLILYHALRDAIRNGQIAHGEQLPATRHLARQYGFSRGTVTLVYDMLWADGYTTAEQGRGTFVTHQALPQAKPAQQSQSPSLSKWAQRLPTISSTETPTPWSFRGGAPLPEREWTQALHSAARDAKHFMGGTLPATGLPELQETIAAHLNRARGLNVQAHQIVITNGSQQALALLIHLLINPNDPVVLENPSYQGAVSAVQTAGGQIIPASVDEEGIVIENWKAKLAVVTPGHQFPTGVVLQRERRLALLKWAQTQNTIIIEDDYDSDFRRAGRPIEPLKILDTQSRVAYIGTFSRVFNRAIRIGYIILPSSLHEPFMQAKHIFEPYPPGLIEQKALALFMKRSHYQRYLKRMTRIYAQRYTHLIHLLNTYLPNAFTFTASEVGTYLFGWWNHSPKTFEQFQTQCQQHGVSWYDTQTSFIQNHRPSAIFGLSRMNETQMQTAVRIMADCYKPMKAK